MPALAMRSATRSGVGQARPTAIVRRSRPAGTATVRRTIAVPFGSGCPAATVPPGSARLWAVSGAGSPLLKTSTPMPTAPAPTAASVAPVFSAAPLLPATTPVPVSRPRGAARGQDGHRAPGVLQPGAEAPAAAARRQVAVDGGGCAAATVVGLQQYRPDVPAVRRARLLMLDQVLPGAVDERLGRARGRAELEREGGVRDAVELAAQEGVALVLGERREVAEHVADPAAALAGHLRLGRVGGAEHAALFSVVEHDGVGPHPRQLVERTVAHEPEEPRPQLDVALVAPQRTARPQHRLLDHVLGLVGRRAEDLAGMALERPPVALIDLLERAVVAPPERRDEALVVGLDAPLRHGTGSGCGSTRPRPRGSPRASTGDPRSGARRAGAAGGRASR